jgi:hypothetical protein
MNFRETLGRHLLAIETRDLDMANAVADGAGPEHPIR